MLARLVLINLLMNRSVCGNGYIGKDGSIIQFEFSVFAASWAPSGKDSGGAPQLKGARWFSYDELKKCSNNFSESNEIGSGGYGKVNALLV